MSHPRGNVAGVTRGEQAEVERIENWSRLQGLMRVLALPPVIGLDGALRRVPVEVEIAPGRWAAVENIWIDADGMTFSYGTNGRSVEYRFHGDACPQWRVVKQAVPHPYRGTAA